MNDWISVNDALPDKSGDYLVYDFNEDVGGNNRITVLEFSSKYQLWNSFDDAEPYKADEYAIDSVLYWMPLPETPCKLNKNTEYINKVIELKKNQIKELQSNLEKTTKKINSLKDEITKLGAVAE